MPICPNCGSHNTLKNKFCGQCGHKLPEPNNYCPNCDITFSTGEKFCTECGKELVNKKEYEEKNKRKIPRTAEERKRDREERARKFEEMRLKREEEYRKRKEELKRKREERRRNKKRIEREIKEEKRKRKEESKKRYNLLPNSIKRDIYKIEEENGLYLEEVGEDFIHFYINRDYLDDLVDDRINDWNLGYDEDDDEYMSDKKYVETVIIENLMDDICQYSSLDGYELDIYIDYGHELDYLLFA